MRLAEQIPYVRQRRYPPVEVVVRNSEVAMIIDPYVLRQLLVELRRLGLNMRVDVDTPCG